jgi:hypothetical protein
LAIDLNILNADVIFPDVRPAVFNANRTWKTTRGSDGLMKNELWPITAYAAAYGLRRKNVMQRSRLPAFRCQPTIAQEAGSSE